MSNVVPDVSLGVIRGNSESSLEAAEGHVVVLGIETANAHVGEDLSIVNPHLKQTPAGKGTNIDEHLLFHKHFGPPKRRDFLGHTINIV